MKYHAQVNLLIFLLQHIAIYSGLGLFIVQRLIHGSLKARLLFRLLTVLNIQTNLDISQKLNYLFIFLLLYTTSQNQSGIRQYEGNQNVAF